MQQLQLNAFIAVEGSIQQPQGHHLHCHVLVVAKDCFLVRQALQHQTLVFFVNQEHIHRILDPQLAINVRLANTQQHQGPPYRMCVSCVLLDFIPQCWDLYLQLPASNVPQELIRLLLEHLLHFFVCYAEKDLFPQLLHQFLQILVTAAPEEPTQLCKDHQPHQLVWYAEPDHTLQLLQLYHQQRALIVSKVPIQQLQDQLQCPFASSAKQDHIPLFLQLYLQLLVLAVPKEPILQHWELPHQNPVFYAVRVRIQLH